MRPHPYHLAIRPGLKPHQQMMVTKNMMPQHHVMTPQQHAQMQQQKMQQMQAHYMQQPSTMVHVPQGLASICFLVLDCSLKYCKSNCFIKVVLHEVKY